MIEHEFLLQESVSPFARADEGRSATYLRALLENSPIATIVLDAQHRYTMCNKAFETLFQYTPHQLSAANLDDLISTPDTAREAADLSRMVLQGTKVHTVTRRRRRGGMLVDVEIYGIPLFVGDELAGIYGLYQDVTERNKAQSAFRDLAGQLETLQLAERRRLARDLHDSTSQELAVLNWNLTRLVALVGDGDQVLQNLVHETREIAQQCSARIRSASYLMHPPLLGNAGLGVAVPSMVETFEQRSGIRVELVMPEDLGRLPDDCEIAIYRTIQEALANVLRHSGSANAAVVLEVKSPWLELTISDHGSNSLRVARMQSGDSSAGVGIRCLRERIEQLGGCLTIHCDQSGTRIAATLPFVSATLPEEVAFYA